MRKARSLPVALGMALALGGPATAADMTYADWIRWPATFKAGYVRALMDSRAEFCHRQDDPRCTVAHFYQSCFEPLILVGMVGAVDLYVQHHPERKGDPILGIVWQTFAGVCGPEPGL